MPPDFSSTSSTSSKRASLKKKVGKNSKMSRVFKTSFFKPPFSEPHNCIKIIGKVEVNDAFFLTFDPVSKPAWMEKKNLKMEVNDAFLLNLDWFKLFWTRMNVRKSWKNETKWCVFLIKHLFYQVSVRMTQFLIWCLIFITWKLAVGSKTNRLRVPERTVTTNSNKFNKQKKSMFW